VREASSEERQCGVKERRAVVSMPGLSGTAAEVRPDAGGRSCRLGETALAGAGETAVPGQLCLPEEATYAERSRAPRLRERIVSTDWEMQRVRR
jgi:hypothetical protein